MILAECILKSVLSVYVYQEYSTVVVNVIDASDNAMGYTRNNKNNNSNNKPVWEEKKKIKQDKINKAL